MRNNTLGGEIPTEFYSLGALKQLYLDYNGNMTGGIPTLIGGLVSLERLRLGHTTMGGPLPDELFHLTNLKEFGVQYNDFEGQMEAAQWLNFTELEDLDISFNDFHGPLPDIFLEFEDLGTSYRRNVKGAFGQILTACSFLCRGIEVARKPNDRNYSFRDMSHAWRLAWGSEGPHRGLCNQVFLL